MSSPRRQQVVTPHADAAPGIAPWLWAMEEARRGVVETVAELDQPGLDWRGPNGTDNSIGSLLYHLALIEMSWLYDDIFLQDPPDEIAALLPHNHRDREGRLTHVPGVPLAEHLQRLEHTRARFLEMLSPMTPTDWHTLREPSDTDYTCSPAWVVYHLVEHEAGHMFQMREIKRRWLATR